jgi:adenylate kinase family enzyme
MRVTHIELDAIHWLPNWRPRPSDEFRWLVEAAVAAAQWVLDGNYSQTRDVVWSRATALIWLNYPLHVVIYRALRQTTRRVFDQQILVDLTPRQGFTLPKGVIHRTRAPERTVLLMIEGAGVTPTGDH